MKVTVVVDNAVPIGARHPFLAEHGLSLLIEHAGKKVLYDTGQSSQSFPTRACLASTLRSWTCWW